MPTSYPPKIIPSRFGLIPPIRRPFNVDKDCVLCLLPEINTKWLDYSGHGNHATLTDTQLKYTGRMGPCLLGDATARYGTISDADSLDVSTTVTFEVWMYPNVVNDHMGLFNKYVASGTNRSFRIKQANKTIYMRISDDGSASEPEETADFVTANKWWHIVITFDSGDWEVYGNGVLQTTATDFTMTEIHNTTSDLLICNHGSDYYDGKIDEMRIYNRVLEAWEIKALYEQGKPGG